MDYSFFLFCKLIDLYFIQDEPYDVLFEKYVRIFESWKSWDAENGKNIGEYESMVAFLHHNGVK